MLLHTQSPLQTLDSQQCWMVDQWAHDTTSDNSIYVACMAAPCMANDDMTVADVLFVRILWQGSTLLPL